MARKYDIPDYDKHLCLKVSTEMWISILYLVHPYWILILSVVNLKDKTALMNAVYPDRLPMSIAAAAAIPALFVLYAWMKRKPEAQDNIRRLWRNGRWFLMTSAILNMVPAIVKIASSAEYKTNTTSWLQIAICAIIVAYLFGSQRVRDTFADFPKEQEDADARG